jgi:CRP-like cAMP-binding protein
VVHRSKMPLDEWRRVRGTLPDFADLDPQRLDQLCAQGHVHKISCDRRDNPLFRHDDIAGSVFVILKIPNLDSRICLTAGMERETGTGKIDPIIEVLGEGDLVAGTELIAIAAGLKDPGPRRVQAAVMTESAHLLEMAWSRLAELAGAEPRLRQRLAQKAADRLDRCQLLLGETLQLKDKGRIRLAKLLLDIFNPGGRGSGNGASRLRGGFHVQALSSGIGVSERSLVDDISALENLGAIDHSRGEGRSTQLILLDRHRLELVAELDQEDKLKTERKWIEYVEEALAAGDTIRALELAQEGSSHFHSPENRKTEDLEKFELDRRLRHATVLAALRSGSYERAQSLIRDYKFSTEYDNAKLFKEVPQVVEDIAALEPRLLKEQAFFSEDPEEFRALAQRSAKGYLSVYERTQGIYTGINAASMMLLAGNEGEGRRIAAHLLDRMNGSTTARGYWELATHAEAACLVGDLPNAIAAIKEAVGANDANSGARASTIRQLRRLKAAGVATAPLLDVLRQQQRPVVFCPLPSEKGLTQSSSAASELAAQLAEIKPSVVFLGCSDVQTAAEIGERVPIAIVLGEAARNMILQLPPRPPFERRHGPTLAAQLNHDTSKEGKELAGISALLGMRLGLGLAIQEAWRREADCQVIEAASRVPWVVLRGDGLADAPGNDGSAVPDWAASDQMPANVRAIVGLDTSSLGFAGWWSRPARASSTAKALHKFAQEMNAEPEGLFLDGQEIPLWSFRSVAQAAAFALRLHENVVERDLYAYVTCDLEAWKTAGPLARKTQLSDIRPVGEVNGIFATEAFSAECALFFRTPLVHIRPVGKLRSLSGGRRLPMYRLSRFTNAGLGVSPAGDL